MNTPVSDDQGRPQQITWKQLATPLTVKQIFNASRIHGDAPIELDGRELGYVYCVGNILSTRVEETYAVVRIEDGTAHSLSVYIFENEDKQISSWPAFKCLVDEGKMNEMKYIRVVGKIRCKGNFRNSITARGISLVEDPHQIFYHLFECAFAYMECKKLLSSIEEDEKEQTTIQGDPSSEPGNRDAASKDEEEGEQPPQELPDSSQSDDSSDDEIEYADDNPVPIEDSSSDEDEEDHNEKQKTEVMSSDDSNSNTSKEEDDETNPTPVSTFTRAQVQTASEIQTETEVDNVPCMEVTDKELSNVERTLEKLRLAPADHSAASPDAAPQVRLPRAQSQPQSKTDPLSGLTNVQRTVILHIQQRRDEIWAEGEEEWFGLHVSELARVVRRLEKVITASEISAMLDDLIENGHIHTTIDELHLDVPDV